MKILVCPTRESIFWKLFFQSKMQHKRIIKGLWTFQILDGKGDVINAGCMQHMIEKDMSGHIHSEDPVFSSLHIQKNL